MRSTTLLLATVATLTACNAPSPRAETPADAKPAAQAPADTQRVVLDVKGMYCEQCESTVGALLRQTPGVTRADVSVDRSEATVVFDPSLTSPAKLIAVITSLGYTASVRPT